MCLVHMLIFYILTPTHFISNTNTFSLMLIRSQKMSHVVGFVWMTYYMTQLLCTRLDRSRFGKKKMFCLDDLLYDMVCCF